MTLSDPIFFPLQMHTAENISLWPQLLQSNIFNFLIAAGFLIWLFRKYKLASILDKKQAQVIKELDDAEEKRAAAMKELEKIEKRTAQLTSEVDAIIDEARKTAEVVGESIVKNAQIEAEKIISSAEKRIALEHRTASRKLEKRLIQEAIYGARQLLESTLTEEDKHRSVEAFVSTLPDLYNKEFKS